MSEDKTVPSPVGPYRPYVRAENFVFCSGQIGLDAAGTLKNSFSEQFQQAMANLEAVLADAGAGLGSIVKTTVFLVDADHFSVMNEAYANYFAASLPARSCVIVKELPRGALVEIEALAHLG